MVPLPGRAANVIPTSLTDSKTMRLAVVYRQIDQLKLNPANPRLHSERQIGKLAESIKAFRFNAPILVDRNLQVVVGQGRLEAAKLLGIKEVPTILLEHLTEPQAKAYVIADNKLAESAAWDNRLLAEHFKSLAKVELDFSLDAIGFEAAEIDLLIEGVEPVIEGGSDPADALPENENTVQVSQNGDLWLLGRHRILCGNSLNAGSYVALMEKRRAAMVFTEPPYNVKIAGHATGLGIIQHRNFQMAACEMSEPEFTDFLARAFSLLAANSVNGSIHFLFMDWRHMGEILQAGKQVYSEFKNLCVWTKDNADMGSLYRSQHELVFVFKNGRDAHRNNVQLGHYGRYRTNVWNYPGVNSFSRSTKEGNLLEFHPTVKPVALVADAIMDCSARGDLVLDSFIGSGTTVIAAERTGRICYGIEIDPTYVDAIIRRWQTFTGLSGMHAISGHSFADLEQEAANEQKQ
jgi:DNA modification methylase